MKAKRILSAIIAAAMTISGAAGICAYADSVPELAATDHTPQTLNANLFRIDDTNNTGRTIRLIGGRTEGADFKDTNVNCIVNVTRINENPTPLNGYVGARINLGHRELSNPISIDASKTYVLTLPMKKLAGDVTVGAAAVNLKGDENNYPLLGSAEYGMGGTKLTDSFELYSYTIKPKATADYSGERYIVVGFAADTAVGDGFAIDTARDDIYFGEEQAASLSNEIKSGNRVMHAGEQIVLQAKTLNQGGNTGTLTQNFKWYALNSDRTAFAEGVTVVPGNDTATATVRVETGAALGEYVIVAVSEDYGLSTGITINVADGMSYNDYIPGDKPTNLFRIDDTNNTGRTIRLIGGRTEGADFKDTNVNCIVNVTRINENPTPLNGYVGARINLGHRELSNPISIDASKTYVLTLPMKKLAGDVTVGAAAVNLKGDENNYPLLGSAEYGMGGTKLTDSFELYSYTIKPKATADYSGERYIVVGFAADTAVGDGFAIDTARDDIYFGEEKAYDITNTLLSESNVLSAGKTLKLKAELVNQAGLVGTLDQSFKWYAVTSDRSSEVSGFTFTENSDGTVNVAADASVAAGNYAIVAVADGTGFAKGVDITVKTVQEKISHLKFEDLDGYVAMTAAVTDTAAEKISFVMAYYTADGTLIGADIENVPVADGSASVKIEKAEALDSGTKVRAFVWADMRPIPNTDNFVVELTVGQ